MEAYDSATLGSLVVSERKTQRYLLFDDEAILRGWANVATGQVRLAPLSLNKLAFSGMQILNPHIFDHMDRVVAEKGDKFSLIDLYLSLCEKMVFKAYIPKNYRMMDVGKIDQIDAAEEFAQSL